MLFDIAFFCLTLAAVLLTGNQKHSEDQCDDLLTEFAAPALVWEPSILWKALCSHSCKVKTCRLTKQCVAQAKKGF